MRPGVIIGRKKKKKNFNKEICGWRILHKVLLKKDIWATLKKPQEWEAEHEWRQSCRAEVDWSWHLKLCDCNTHLIPGLHP